jgi:hypothetical protein
MVPEAARDACAAPANISVSNAAINPVSHVLRLRAADWSVADINSPRGMVPPVGTRR